LAFHSGREADHSPPSSAEVKEWVELDFYSPNTPSWRGAQLGGTQGQLYLYFGFKETHEGTQTTRACCVPIRQLNRRVILVPKPRFQKTFVQI
jgi:hypothetical protein